MCARVNACVGAPIYNRYRYSAYCTRLAVPWGWANGVLLVPPCGCTSVGVSSEASAAGSRASPASLRDAALCASDPECSRATSRSRSHSMRDVRCEMRGTAASIQGHACMCLSQSHGRSWSYSRWAASRRSKPSPPCASGAVVSSASRCLLRTIRNETDCVILRV